VNLKKETNACSHRFIKAEQDDISMWEAIFKVVVKAIPSSLSLLIQNAILFFNLLFLGVLDDSILMTGCSLGVVMINLIMLSVDSGLIGGIDTLVSQAYGQKDYQM